MCALLSPRTAAHGRAAAAKDDSAFATLASKEGIRPTRPTLPYRVPADALDASKFVKFKVAAVEDVSADTKIVTFRLKPMQALGLQTASCVVVRAEIDGKPVIRPYTPMSDAYYRGSFKLLVKAYPDGKMSRHINSLKPGDYLEMKGPIQKVRFALGANVGACGAICVPFVQRPSVSCH